MPMYEYKCAHCGKRFELIQKFSDAPLTVHEECGSGPVERLISAPALVFKGSGWYVNDYAKSNGTATEGKSKEGSQSESKTEGKSDSGKSESGKSESSASDSSTSSKTESSSPKSESSTPAASV